jgi:hypothetical protein
MSDNENREMIERPSFLPSVDSAKVAEDNALMNQYCQPPRLKIVQALSGEPFKPPFTDKDAVVVPQMIKIGGEGEPFSFTPIFFFPSWACWNPLKMKATLPAVRDFTLDANTPLARKCMSFTREPCPENPQEQLRYCEHLNFYYMVHGVEELVDIPIIHAFVRGEVKSGKNLIGLLQTRKAPKYACRIMGIPADHKGKEGSWYGLDFVNDNPDWVTEAQYVKYEKLAEDLKNLVESRSVTIDHGDSDVETVNGEPPSEF